MEHKHLPYQEITLKYCYILSLLHEIRKRKANWIGHILRRNCLLQQVIEGKIKGQIEVTRRRGRRRKKLLDDLKDMRGYCQLKEEALDRSWLLMMMILSRKNRNCRMVCNILCYKQSSSKHLNTHFYFKIFTKCWIITNKLQTGT